MCYCMSVLYVVKGLQHMCYCMSVLYVVKGLQHMCYCMSVDSSQKPGPGAHSPEKVNIHLKSSPAPTMGIRHSEFICPLITEPSV